jgi:hypothetical protein
MEFSLWVLSWESLQGIESVCGLAGPWLAGPLRNPVGSGYEARPVQHDAAAADAPRQHQYAPKPNQPKGIAPTGKRQTGSQAYMV